MKTSLDAIAAHAKAALLRHQTEPAAEAIAVNCAWLHGAGYNGLKYLAEALTDEVRSVALEKDLMGLDLHGVS